MKRASLVVALLVALAVPLFASSSLSQSTGSNLADITLSVDASAPVDCHLYTSSGDWLGDCSVGGSNYTITLNDAFSGFVGPYYSEPGNYIVVISNYVNGGCSQETLATCRTLESAEPDYAELSFTLQ